MERWGCCILENCELLKKLTSVLGEGEILLDEPMKNHTSFKIGGPADILVSPANSTQLGEVIRHCIDTQTPYLIMGNGTNLLVSDKGIRGVVVKIFENMSDYTVNGEFIEFGAGMLISKASKIACRNSLSGLEFAEGIPGTIGGAVAMNAGAYNGEMSLVVYQTEYMDESGSIITVTGEQHAFSYRTSIIQKNKGIVLKTRLKLKQCDSKIIQEAMDDYNFRRKDKQPLEWPSAGSVFKRPEGYFVGKLIDDCGLRGYSIGGAKISDKHSGFIINTGNAECKDVLELIKLIRSTVKEKFNVELEPEQRIVGDFSV
jgi:UDP-N-acetylmuramate dehydrogenase